MTALTRRERGLIEDALRHIHDKPTAHARANQLCVVPSVEVIEATLDNCCTLNDMPAAIRNLLTGEA